MALGNDINLKIGATDKTGTAFRSAETGMKRLAGSAKMLAGSLGMAFGAAAVVTGLTRLAKGAIDYGSAITDAAAATRVGVEEWQVLKYGAQEAGTSMDKVTLTLAKIQKATNDAKNGLTTYTRAFDALGINVDEFQRLSPDQQFVELGRAMVNSKDQATAYASVMDIIGSRNAPQLMEVLKKLGTDGFDSLAEAARNAGQVMSEETAKNMDDAADAIARAGTRITTAAAGALSKWMEFNEYIGKTLASWDQVEIHAPTISGTDANGNTLLPMPELSEDQTKRIKEGTAADAERLGIKGSLLEKQREETAAIIETGEAIAALGEISSEATDVQLSNLEQWLNSSTTYQDMVMHSMQDMSTQMTSSFHSFCQEGELDFKSFAGSIMQNIADMVFQMTVAIPIAKALAAALTGGGGGGGFGGMVGGFVSGMFGGGKASGGDVYAGRSYLVGEKGPEIMTTRSNGSVIPNEALAGGGTTINFNVTAIDSASFSQHLAKHRAEISGIVENAYSRRGRRGPLTA